MDKIVTFQIDINEGVELGDRATSGELDQIGNQAVDYSNAGKSLTRI